MHQHASSVLLGLLLLSAGASAQAEAPQVTRQDRFGAWGLTCAVAQDAAAGVPVQRCMISQLVGMDPKQPRFVLGVTVDYLDARDMPTMRLRFAAGAQTAAGIGIKIDRGPELRLPIRHCDSSRCESVGRLTPEVLKLWRTGKLAQLAFVGRDGQQVLLPIPLAGFDAALSALVRQNR